MEAIQEKLLELTFFCQIDPAPLTQEQRVEVLGKISAKAEEIQVIAGEKMAEVIFG